MSTDDSTSSLMSSGVYCTIVAQNYLPQALSLYDSVRAVEPERSFHILVVDGERKDLESGRAMLSVWTTDELGLPDGEAENLAAIYDVVEFSTALKPIFLMSLLASAKQAVYLDPDMYLVSPMHELEALVDQFGVVLTPHFLERIPPGSSYISEIHSLTTGVHNLGFCAVGQKGIEFLEWWWEHLQRECLIYPLLGLFVDQKWTDVGANLFAAHSLRHYGYNVGPWNLHERSFVRSDSEWKMTASGHSLRLLHFSGFDPHDPDAVSVRLSVSLRDVGARHIGLSHLGHDYARLLLQHRSRLGAIPSYAFDRDSSGRLMTKRIRRAYRKALLTSGETLPSPFDPDDATAFKLWRRNALRITVGITLADGSLAAKYAFPDMFSRLKSLAPTQFGWIRERLLKAGEVRR